MKLTVQNAEVKTATVEVKTLTNAEIAKDVEIVHGEDWHAQEERYWPDRVERQAEAFRGLLDLAQVMREDYYDNGADHVIRLLARVYGIKVPDHG